MCGGNVTPVDDQRPFGYCEVCGIVYALKDRMQERRTHETPTVVKLQSKEEPRGPDNPSSGAFADTEESTKRSGSHWRCPDCGVDLYADDDSDLEFVKREHIREYHPNRSS